MSQFFNSTFSAPHAECVLRDAMDYIPEEIIVLEPSKLRVSTTYLKDDGEELMVQILKNRQLRMYGSPKELTENVKIFGNTPGTWRMSNSHATLLYPYYTTPVIYKSLKGEEYICKSDAYLILQNMTLETYPFEKPEVLRSLIAIYLRSQELENLKNVEFVKFDQKVFDEIKEEIRENMSHFMTDPSEVYPLMRELSACQFPQLLEKFKNLIPIEWKDDDAEYFMEMLTQYSAQFKGAPNFVNLLTTLFYTTGETVKILKKVIEEKSAIFKSQKSPITVRLFEDGVDRKFVMKVELLSVIDEGFEMNPHKQCFETFTMKEVLEEYGDRIQNIEFIITPILRAQHKAVPVAIPFITEYGILAVDAFFQNMKTLIHGHKCFQKTQDVGWEYMDLMFKTNTERFKSEEKNPYFLPLNSLWLQISLLFHNQAKDVRNAKKDGFTVQNLKNELAYLGLTKIFPEIQKHADVVYSEVVKKKKEEFLRTCDLFDALEHCQLICVIKRLPNIKKFLHNQKGCSRVYGYKCEECELEKKKDSESEKTPEDVTASKKDSDTQIEIQEAPEFQNIPEVVKTSKDDSEVEKDFIRYPIVRAKHRMVPVKIYNPPDGYFTVLAVDGLFELLREAIFTLKLFQGPHSAPDLLLQTTSIFESHQKFPYFLTLERLGVLTNMWKNKLENMSKIGVRNAKKDGFTLQNLKNELAHLGLLETFPEIQKHADVVYSEVVKKKKEKFLRTCDLFDAVEHCQLNCIFEKFDFLKKFLHNQKGCHRVYGYKCEECDKIQKASEVKKAPEVPTSTSEFKNSESRVQKTSDGPKTSEFKKTSQTSSDTKNVPEDAKTSSESKVQKTSSSKVTKPPQSIFSTQKTSNNAPDAEKQKTSDLKTSESQKTSSNCEKCHRVCEMLNETKKELKSTEKKVKNLEKKERKVDKFEKDRVENMEREIQKLKGEIKEKEETMAKIKDEKSRQEEKSSAKEKEFEEFKKIQKEKLNEKEGEIQIINVQNSTYKSTISQLKTENLRHEEVQKLLEEKNSKLEKELEAEKMKTLEIQKSSQKTSSELESEILEKNRKLEEFKESEIRMKAENEVNQKMIQQLMDKLGGGGANYSSPSTSSENRQKCEICWNPTENHQSVKCQKCRRPFHSECASNWLKSYSMCPTCDGKFQ